jgi:hypothetical protein
MCHKVVLYTCANISGEPATSVFGIKEQEEYKEVVWVLEDGGQDWCLVFPSISLR